MSARLWSEWETALQVWAFDQVADKVPAGIRAPWIVLDAEMDFVAAFATAEQAKLVATALNAAIEADHFAFAKEQA